MSEFFESDTQVWAAEDLQQRLRAEEGRHGERRKVVTGAIAGAVALAVLLGGGIAAFAATRRPVQAVRPTAIVVPAKTAKAKVKAHKTKHRKPVAKKAAHA